MPSSCNQACARSVTRATRRREADTESLRADDYRRYAATFHPSNAARVGTVLSRIVEPIAKRHAASVAQVALAWLLAQPGLSAVIVGASSPAQARANAAAAELQLTDLEIRALRQAFQGVNFDPHAGRGPASRFKERLRRVAGRVRSGLGRRVSR